MSPALRRVLAGGLALALLTWLLALRRTLSYDEGVYSQTFKLLGSGHRLVSDVFTSQPPLWPYLGLPGWLAGGVTGARLESVCWALVCLVAYYRVARAVSGPGPAVAATVLLGAAPAFVTNAGAIEAELPALAVAMVALELALRRGGPRWTPVAAGAVFGVALMVKLLVAPMVLPLLVALWTRRRPSAAAAGLVSASAVVVAVGAVFWTHGDLWSQVIGFHVASQTWWQGLKHNLSTMSHALGTCVLLVAAGLCAFDKIVRRSPGHEVLISWYAAAMAFLVLHVPVFTHHLVLAAGPAVLLVVLELQRRFTGRSRELALAVLLGASVVGSLISDLAGPGLATAGNNAAVAELRRLPQHAVLVTDDQVLATAAGRTVPGPLVDTSDVRISSGDLTAADVCDQIAHADAVLLTTGGRFRALPQVGACTRSAMQVAWRGPGGVLYVRAGVQLGIR